MGKKDAGRSALQLSPHVFHGKRIRKASVRLIEVLDVNSSQRQMSDKGKPGKGPKDLIRYSPEPATGIGSNPYSRRSRNVTARFSSMMMVNQRYEHRDMQGLEEVEKNQSQPPDEIDESDFADKKRNHPITKSSANSQIIKLARPVLSRRGLPARAVSMALAVVV
jgi:hypothetical protein